MKPPVIVLTLLCGACSSVDHPAQFNVIHDEPTTPVNVHAVVFPDGHRVLVPDVETGQEFSP